MKLAERLEKRDAKLEIILLKIVAAIGTYSGSDKLKYLESVIENNVAYAKQGLVVLSGESNDEDQD